MLAKLLSAVVETSGHCIDSATGLLDANTLLGSCPEHSPMPEIGSELPQEKLPPLNTITGLVTAAPVRVFPCESFSWYMTLTGWGLATVEVPSTARTDVAVVPGQC